MALFNITAEDVARGTLLQPNWYVAEITKCEDDKTKGGDDCVNVYMKALDGVDEEGNSAPNVPVFRNFMPKYPSFAINFLNALGANIGKQGKSDLNISDETCKGKRLKVYIKRGEYNGKGTNEVADFKPLDA